MTPNQANVFSLSEDSLPHILQYPRQQISCSKHNLLSPVPTKSTLVVFSNRISFSVKRTEMFTTIKILLGKNATYDQEHLAGFFLKIEFVFSKHAPPTHTHTFCSGDFGQFRSCYLVTLLGLAPEKLEATSTLTWA